MDDELIERAIHRCIHHPDYGKRTYVGSWEHWFAWYPVFFDGKLHWMEIVKCRKIRFIGISFAPEGIPVLEEKSVWEYES